MAQQKTAMIRARTTRDLKEAVERVLRLLGISPSEAINMFYAQIALKKRIPFEVSLEAGDIPENYIKVKDADHFASLIGLESE